MEEGVAQIEDVNSEQPKEHEGLRPLGGVPPEHAGIFDEEGANIWPQPVEAIDQSFRPTFGIAPILTALEAEAEPFPARKGAGAAMHSRSRIVKQVPHPGESEHAKE